MTLDVLAPIDGVILPLSEVDDPVFSGEIVGPGIALVPTGDTEVAVRAPVSGRVITLHPHAFVILSAEGPAVLVHLGVDTVSLRGAGFTTHAERGDTVTVGDTLITWHPATTRDAGLAVVVPVVVLDVDRDHLHVPHGDGACVTSGDVLFTVTH